MIKKFLFGLFLIFVLVTTSFAASKTYTKNVLIGGGTSALDAIDGDDLADGYKAIVINSIGSYFYYLDATSGLTEAPPYIISPDTNAGNKRWRLQNDFIGSGVVSVKWFGATGDGVTNDYAAIQAAVTAGTKIYFPEGTYSIETKLTIIKNSVILYGDVGSVDTYILNSIGTTSDAVEFTTTTPNDSTLFNTGCGMHDISILGTSAATAGTGLTVRKHTGFKLNNVNITKFPVALDLVGIRGGFFGNFKLYSSLDARVVSSALLRIRSQLNSDVSYSTPWFNQFSNFVIGATQTVDSCIEIRQSDNSQFVNGYINQGFYADLQVLPDISGEFASALFTNVYFDSNGVTDYGFIASNGDGGIGYMKFVNCHFGGYDINGAIIVEDTIGNISFVNSYFSNIDSASIACDSTGVTLDIIGNYFYNGRTDLDTGAIVNIANSRITKIIGNTFRNDAAPTPNVLAIAWAGNHDQGLVEGNTIINCDSGNITNAGTFADSYRQVGNNTDNGTIDDVLSDKLILGSLTGIVITSGAGSPEGALAAPVGSIYTDIAGSTGTTLYIKETGTTTNTGWAAK
jgi:hypothetical protein